MQIEIRDIVAWVSPPHRWPVAVRTRVARDLPNFIQTFRRETAPVTIPDGTGQLDQFICTGKPARTRAGVEEEQ
jgi:hypothetical protein